ncbi:MAG: alkaline phosphatase family protein, partial [Dehalococcoidia bacterium]
QKPLDQRAVPRSYAFPVGARAPGFTHAFMMFTPKSIAGSVYSRYSAGDAPFSGFGRLRQGVEAIVERIASATGPTYSYLYVSDVDTAEHVYGPRSSQVARSLDDVQTQIAELARRLDGRGRVVVTADHGQLLVDASMTLHRDDPLVGLLSVPPTGDGRAPLFHVAEGQGDAFTRAFRERFGKDFALLQVDEAAAMGLFGPTALSAETHRRLGDFVGIATGGAALLYEPAPELATMPGHHGGLSPDEMRIPLISA